MKIIRTNGSPSRVHSILDPAPCTTTATTTTTIPEQALHGSDLFRDGDVACSDLFIYLSLCCLAYIQTYITT